MREAHMIRGIHCILYVQEQEHSMEFYRTVLAQEPRLHVPGMTEFELPGGVVLGLMPEAGIVRLLGNALPNPVLASGIPRVELYLCVDDASVFHQRALAAGARELSGVELRNWGDRVGYSLDPDGHVVAFADTNKTV